MATIINQVYEQYHVPKNLQRHMLRVASVGRYIALNLDEELDVDVITSALLLHDMGNLLKFDLNSGLQLFDEEEQNREYWEEVKKNMQKKYGPDEHHATVNIAKEIGIAEPVLFIISNMGSENLLNATNVNDLPLKVSTYADFRVGPDGYLTVKKRFEDVIDRYKNTNHILSDVEKTRQNYFYCLELEEQLDNLTSIDITDLPEKKLDEASTQLTTYSLEKTLSSP